MSIFKLYDIFNLKINFFSQQRKYTVKLSKFSCLVLNQYIIIKKKKIFTPCQNDFKHLFTFWIKKKKNVSHGSIKYLYKIIFMLY